MQDSTKKGSRSDSKMCFCRTKTSAHLTAGIHPLASEVGQLNQKTIWKLNNTGVEGPK